MTRRCESPNSIPSLNKSLRGAVCKSLANCTLKGLSSVLEENLSWTRRKSSIICGYLGYHTKLTINGTWNQEIPLVAAFVHIYCRHFLSTCKPCLHFPLFQEETNLVVGICVSDNIPQQRLSQSLLRHDANWSERPVSTLKRNRWPGLIRTWMWQRHMDNTTGPAKGA